MRKHCTYQPYIEKIYKTRLNMSKNKQLNVQGTVIALCQQNEKDYLVLPILPGTGMLNAAIIFCRTGCATGQLLNSTAFGKYSITPVLIPSDSMELKKWQF
jgi:hypothetical protein